MRRCTPGLIPAVLLLLVGGDTATSAQRKPPVGAPTPDPRQETPSFQSKVELVLVPVVVRDAHGNTVGNLTRDDFQLFDRGKQQAIVSFSQAPTAGHGPAPERVGLPVAASSAENSASAASDTPADRHLVYFFDDLNASFTDLAAVRNAATRHLEHLAASDRAAIYTMSGQSMLDFTGDRDKLAQTVQSLRTQLTFGHGGTECPEVSLFLADRVLTKGDDRAHRAIVERTVQCARVPEPTAEAIAIGAEHREMEIGEQDVRIFARRMRSAIQRLAALPGKRVIVMTSPGFFMRTAQGIRAMAGLLQEAIQSHVVINALDARGLYTNQPDTLGAPGKLWQEYQRQDLDASKDVMRDLTQATGGAFVDNSDDLRAGFDRLTAAPDFSYVLGFSPRDLKLDGSFHALKVRLVAPSGATIEARPGYYALQPETAEEAARSEINDAVFSGTDAAGIPVGLQTIYSKPDAHHARLTVIAVIDIRSLHFEKSAGRNRGSLTLVAALFDRKGKYLRGLTKNVDLGLRDAAIARPGSEITVPSRFDVAPGTYEVRLVVRESAEGRLTSCGATVQVR